MRQSGRQVVGKGGARSKQAHQVRIIGGQWKRTPLPVLDAEGLRPTTDRVRETVFNWLTHLLGSDWGQLRCLDVFSGSGALGFEAASRGASHVALLENHPEALRHLRAAKDKLAARQVEITGGDALASLRRLATNADKSQHFDVIFVDPPYHLGWLDRVMPLFDQLLADHGLVYVECEMPLEGTSVPAWMDGWEVVRADKAGMVFYHVLQRKEMPEMGHNARSV